MLVAQRRVVPKHCRGLFRHSATVHSWLHCTRGAQTDAPDLQSTRAGQALAAGQKGFARRDLAALAGVVETRQYLVGDKLSGLDFTVADMLAGFLDKEPFTWLTEVAREFPPLAEYAERIQKEPAYTDARTSDKNNAVPCGVGRARDALLLYHRAFE